jgi:Protein of unknown function (DUF3103)
MRPIRTRVLAAAAVTISAAAVLNPIFPGVAHAAPASVNQSKLALARALALSFQDSRWAGTVRTALSNGGVDALTLARQSGTAGAAGFRRAAEPANAAILAAKGLPADTGSVIQVWVAGAPNGAISLVAAEPSDDGATSVPAYDRSGDERQLAVAAPPTQPVAVVGVDERRTLAAGVTVVRDALAAHHIGTGGQRTASTDGYWTTRVMHVRLNDDEEPWFKGAAEIYTIVSGVGTDGQPHVDIVQMPYLDYDGTDYYPGQILVDWSHFMYNAVDAVMMEEDDGTNYRALAQALVTALLTVLSGAQYAPMVDAILQAMPDSWWTDDPDYVDSWYLLTRQVNERRIGARANGTIDFQPYYVTAL